MTEISLYSGLKMVSTRREAKLEIPQFGQQKRTPGARKAVVSAKIAKKKRRKYTSFLGKAAQQARIGIFIAYWYFCHIKLLGMSFRFFFDAPPPNVAKLNVEDMADVTVLLLKRKYHDQLFVKIGWSIT